MEAGMSKDASKGKPRGRRKKGPAGPIGLRPEETRAEAPAPVKDLCRAIEDDGGAALAAYRDPLGGRWLVLAALPVEQVEPTPYQRGLSEAHVKRLADAIGRTGRYLDPIIALRVAPKRYHTPNGSHRLATLKHLAARAVTALVVTEPEVARLILALNVEKAHNLREKCLEVIKLARDMASLPGVEADFSLEFEQAAYLTLGTCYEQNGRFAGGAYHPLLRRVDVFLDKPLAKALDARAGHAKALMEIDARVGELVAALKAKGMESPYLKHFVVARLNPIRFRPGATMPIAEALAKMAEAANKFSPEKISVADLARSGAAAAAGGSEEA